MRITLYCVAESFDRKRLEPLLRQAYPAAGSVKAFPDVLYVEVGVPGIPGCMQSDAILRRAGH